LVFLKGGLMSKLLEPDRNNQVIWFSWVFVVAFFVLDLLIPPAIAVGTLYVIVIFMLAQSERHEHLVSVACLCVTLVILDTFASGPDQISWGMLANRVMSVLAIAIATALLLQQKNLREQDKAKDILFRNLLESAPDAVVIVNERGLIELTNKQVEVLFGYRKAELIGRHVEMLIPQRYVKDHSRHRKGYFEAPAARSMGQNFDLFALKSSGDEFPVEISLSPLHTDQGLLVSAAIRDVTERREADEKFRDLLNSAPDAMVIVNQAGDIELANKQTEILFGYGSEELVGQKIETLLPERFQGKHTGHRQSFFNSPNVRGMGQGLELFGQKKDGCEFPVEISLSPLETKAGLLVSAAIRDVSEHKGKERELSRYARQLESKNKELEQFAYIASHDLQEPLRTISSFVDLLVEDYGDKMEAEADTYLNYISDASHRMTQLIKGLLDYSRIGSQSQLSEVDCGQLLLEITKDLDVAIAEQGAEISWLGLPTLVTYGSELRQLLQNLIANAIKFHSPGAKPIVQVSAKLHAGMWKITVTDNGIGIEAQYMERIFMIFQRLHTRQEYEGTGIGLAHCKKIVELLGGSIWVESVPGEGSRFHFTAADRWLEWEDVDAGA
jgi:PAS domain S-box-containing protein